MRRKWIILCLMFVLFLMIGTACEEEHVSLPGTLQYNGTRYHCTGGFIDTPAIRKTHIGKITALVPVYEFPQQDFETNMDGLLDGNVYLLEDGDIIVEYSGEAYGDWCRFSNKTLDFE